MKKGLTDTAIAKRKWSPRPEILADRAGLRLACYSRGVKTWQMRAEIFGKPVTLRVGAWPDMSVSAARRRALAMRAAIARGEDPRRSKTGSRVTFGAFAKRWMKEIVSSRRKNPEAVQRVLDRDLIPRLGTLPMTAVTAELIIGIVFAKRDAGHPATAVKVRDLLARLFSYAEFCGVVDRNPAKSVERKFLGTLKPRQRSLSEAELRLFFAGLPKVGIRSAYALELLLLTLARKGELMAARWRDVDLERQVWEVPAEISKSGRPHVVYLSPRALHIFHVLASVACSGPLLPPAGWYVFSAQNSNTQPMNEAVLNKAIARVRWGMPRFTPHDLRRTGSTLLNEKGYPADVIEKALNHSVRGIRGVYNKAQYAEQRKQMLAEWGAYLEGLK